MNGERKYKVCLHFDSKFAINKLNNYNFNYWQLQQIPVTYTQQINRLSHTAILTLMRLRGPITPGFNVYASSMLGPVAGVNFRVSALLFLEGLTLEDGLLLVKD